MKCEGVRQALRPAPAPNQAGLRQSAQEVAGPGVGAGRPSAGMAVTPGISAGAWPWPHQPLLSNYCSAGAQAAPGPRRLCLGFPTPVDLPRRARDEMGQHPSRRRDVLCTPLPVAVSPGSGRGQRPGSHRGENGFRAGVRPKPPGRTRATRTRLRPASSHALSCAQRPHARPASSHHSFCKFKKEKYLTNEQKRVISL